MSGRGSRRHRLLRVVACLLATGALAFASRSAYEDWASPDDPSLDRVLPEVRVPPERPGAETVRFVAIGDTGTGGRGQRAVARGLARRFAREPADFLLLLGDNFYPSGVASVDDPQWDSKVWQPYGGLGIPVHALLGNHDHDGDWRAQVERSAVDARWRMPGPWYRFSRSLGGGESVDFFVLDTEGWFDEASERTGDEQLRWLDAELEGSTARWKIVAGHHPVRSHSHGGTHTMRLRLEPVLVRNGVDLYLAGHDHCLQVLGPHESVTYVVSGGGGGDDRPDQVRWEDDTLFAATRGGFVAFRLDVDSIVVEVARADGDTAFVTELRKEGTE